MAGWLELSDWRAARAIVLGALVLMWPAFWNGYPILYSDTNAFLVQGILDFFIWDKPYIYGPWMALFHWKYSLWPVLLAQALIVSSILWLTAESFSSLQNRAQDLAPVASDRRIFLLHINQSDTRFVLVCIALSILTAASWFTSLLMPDIFAPITVLCIYILAARPDLAWGARLWVLGVGAFAICSHLSHLVIAAAVLLVVACMTFKRLKIAILPLVLALVVLIGTNLYGFQKFAVSPFGSVFLLARLAADGHIKPVLERTCADHALYLCDWKDRLASDSDAFMWDGQGPVWKHPGGPIGLAPEASILVRAAVKSYPFGVAQSLLNNTGRQLVMIGLGDTLHPDHLDTTIAVRLQKYFPPAELERFQRSKQAQDTLAHSAPVFNILVWVSVLIGCIACLYAGLRAWVVSQRRILLLLAMVLAGIFANAFATGALSKPHYRYQTRIAWLLVCVPLILPRKSWGTPFKDITSWESNLR